MKFGSINGIINLKAAELRDIKMAPKLGFIYLERAP